MDDSRSDRQPTPLAKALPPTTHRPPGGFLLGRLLLTQVAPPRRPA
ncbi:MULTISPECIES: hypothetical protein [Nocardia]|jgi:hypothetical protein|nr:MULTISPECIES: hypothetical protein [Nocardia]